MYKKLLMNLAWIFNLPITIACNDRTEKGFLSTTLNNPFGKFYLHEKRKGKYLHRVILSGNINDIKWVQIL